MIYFGNAISFQHFKLDFEKFLHGQHMVAKHHGFTLPLRFRARIFRKYFPTQETIYLMKFSAILSKTTQMKTRTLKQPQIASLNGS